MCSVISKIKTPPKRTALAPEAPKLSKLSRHSAIANANSKLRSLALEFIEIIMKFEDTVFRVNISKSLPEFSVYFSAV